MKVRIKYNYDCSSPRMDMVFFDECFINNKKKVFELILGIAKHVSGFCALFCRDCRGKTVFIEEQNYDAFDRSFTIKRMLSVNDDAPVSLNSVYLSQSGANVLMNLGDLDDEYPVSLYLYSGDFGLIDKALLSKMKKFSMKDMRRLTDDANVYNLWGSLLSDNIAAIVASSAYSRTSFKGRYYVFLYDFRTRKILWQRKSSREFPWNGFVAVCWCSIALSHDEQFLAVMSGGKIYIYRMNYSEVK